MNPYALCLVIGLAVGGIGAWTVQGWRFNAEKAEELEQAQELRRNNQRAADLAASGFESKRNANEVRYQTVTETIERIIDRPVYLNQCLDDDGLRVLNGQIRRDPGEP